MFLSLFVGLFTEKLNVFSKYSPECFRRMQRGHPFYFYVLFSIRLAGFSFIVSLPEAPIQLVLPPARRLNGHETELVLEIVVILAEPFNHVGLVANRIHLLSTRSVQALAQQVCANFDAHVHPPGVLLLG